MYTTRRINSVVVHLGFMTYALIAAIALIGIAILSPPIFAKIIEALRQLASAATGH